MKRAGKILSAVSTALLVLAMVLALLVAVQVRQNGFVSLGGRSLFRVVTGSMEPTISTGALLICRETPAEDIRVGDIICYRSTDGDTAGWVITHRVVRILESGGDIYFETRGDANAVSDGGFVSAEALVGRVAWYSAPDSSYAKAVSALSSKTGFLALILLPCLIVAGVLLSRSVRSLRQELNALLRLEQKEATQSECYRTWGITEEEYAQMRQRIYRELLAEKDAIMEAVRRQLAEEENQGETHEHQVFQPNTGSEKDREQPEKTAEKTG